jgi:cell division transport system permease protein
MQKQPHLSPQKSRRRRVTLRSSKPSFTTSLIKLRRIAKAGVQNIFRNAWLTAAATAIMVVTLLVVSLGIILSTSLNSTVDKITKEVALEIFLLDDSDPTLQEQLKNQISQDENVKSIEYVSKEQALKQFQDDFSDDDEILSGLSLAQDTLPASFRVYLYDLTKVDSSIDIARSQDYSVLVDDVNFDEQRKASIDRIASWQDFIIMSSLVVGSVFAFISVLIIFNTIRMAIYTRSYEIEIMKLIGATPGYIRGPFLFEASMYGIIAGTITIIFLYTVVLNGLPQLGQFLEFESTTSYLKDYWLVVVVLVYGIGILIGFLSAVIAMAKYLRIKKW